MGLSMSGLGLVLAGAGRLFAALEWLGSAHLGYLGVISLLSLSSSIDMPDASLSPTNTRSLVGRGMHVGASSPKFSLFFGALFPQFIDPLAPRVAQFLILSTKFIFFEMCGLTVYEVTASMSHQWLRRPRGVILFNQVTGGVFLLAAGLLATTKRDAT